MPGGTLSCGQSDSNYCRNETKTVGVLRTLVLYTTQHHQPEPPQRTQSISEHLAAICISKQSIFLRHLRTGTIARAPVNVTRNCPPNFMLETYEVVCVWFWKNVHSCTRLLLLPDETRQRRVRRFTAIAYCNCVSLLSSIRFRHIRSIDRGGS